MHIPFIIAVLALLAFALLPVLDRSARAESNAKNPRAYLSRVSRWMKR
jgi:hypothetical protein